MPLKQSSLLIKAALFAISIVGVYAADLSNARLFSDSGCITFINHAEVDLRDWACESPLGGSLWVDDGHYKITVYSGFEGGEDPPQTSKPSYMQSIEWSGHPEDVSVPENGCLHTVAKPGKEAQQIGACAPREPYKGPAMSNPYWQKNDFYKQRPNLRTSNDPGMDPLASNQVASTEIASTEIAPTEIAPTEIAPTEIAPTEIAPTEIAFPEMASTELNTAQTAEPVAVPPAFADAGIVQPLPLADFTIPEPEYTNFNTKRIRKRSLRYI